MAIEQLWERVAERGPTWTVRVTLDVLRERGMDFDRAWHLAHARLRIQPNMSADDVEELLEAKAWMDWSRDYWQACFDREPVPRLVDGEVFLPAESVRIDTAVRESGTSHLS